MLLQNNHRKRRVHFHLPLLPSGDCVRWSFWWVSSCCRTAFRSGAPACTTTAVESRWMWPQCWSFCPRTWPVRLPTARPSTRSEWGGMGWGAVLEMEGVYTYIVYVYIYMNKQLNKQMYLYINILHTLYTYIYTYVCVHLYISLFLTIKKDGKRERKKERKKRKKDTYYKYNQLHRYIYIYACACMCVFRLFLKDLGNGEGHLFLE